MEKAINNTADGFEKNFISSYDGWGLINTMYIQFQESILNRDIGPYKAGDCVESICFDFEHCIGSIYGNRGQYDFNIAVCDLGPVVTDRKNVE